MTATATPRDVADLATPALVIDADVVAARVDALRSALAGFDVHYAVKANPAPQLIARLAALGVGFDVASQAEAELVIDTVGVDPAGLIYAHPVKPAVQLTAAHRLGVTRFAVDSVDEIVKVARYAPGAHVFIRMAPTVRSSAVVPLTDKFGVTPHEVAELVTTAVAVGLEPDGLSFHVGSQSTDITAWAAAVDDAGAALADTYERTGVRLGWVDVGGGFPSSGHPGWPVPSIDEIGAAIRAAFDRLPWPVHGACEPGRFLVGDAGTVHTTVIGTATRGGQRWVYLDAGVFHGLSEVLTSCGGFPFDVTVDDVGVTDGSWCDWVIAGPTCDSADRLTGTYRLPTGLSDGDRLRITSTGAYSVALTTTFNGFAPMTAWILDASELTAGDAVDAACISVGGR